MRKILLRFFSNCCKRFCDYFIHRIEKGGNKNAVSNYGYKNTYGVYDNFIEGKQTAKEKARKLLIIANDPGMAKTTILIITILIPIFYETKFSESNTRSRYVIESLVLLE